MEQSLSQSKYSEINDKLALITQLFLELLKVENSGYKYRLSHVEYFSHLDINDNNMVEHLVECCRIIRSEWGKCRGHNPNEGQYEVKIFALVKELLLPLLDEKYEEYVRLLEREKYKRYSLCFDTDRMTYYKPTYDATIDATMEKKSKEHIQHIANNLKEIYMLQDLNCLVRINCLPHTLQTTSKLFGYFNTILLFNL